MSLNRNALVPVLLYLVFVVAALLSDMNIGADEFLLEEANHATAITAPFSILLSGVTFLGIDILESNTAAYVIWIVSAALNSVVLYMLSKRIFSVIGSGEPARQSAKTA